jgi:3',5'-cyclic AMP phosphodiesterase CpdA
MLGMPRRYYSFDQAGWHFIMLDSNGFAQDKEQWDWLIQELDKADTKKTPVAILSHQPIFSMGAMVNSPGDHIGNWKGLVALFVKHPSVKLCLSGHTHLYDQALYNGITYVGGGSLAGYWWEKEKSDDGKGAYRQTRPGYGILRLYADGQVKYDYIKYDN